MANEIADPRVTKRRVTMTSFFVTGVDADNQPIVEKHEAVDYVRPDHLDAYVADAQTKWQAVKVSDEPDAGPGGYEGQTTVPSHLDLPDAGVTYPAETED
jgi:hypothetical protein